MDELVIAKARFHVYFKCIISSFIPTTVIDLKNQSLKPFEPYRSCYPQYTKNKYKFNMALTVVKLFLGIACIFWIIAALIILSLLYESVMGYFRNRGLVNIRQPDLERRPHVRNNETEEISRVGVSHLIMANSTNNVTLQVPSKPYQEISI